MDNRLHCFNKLEELFSLYDKVRQSVILLENFNEEQKMYIAPINQLRSALDHIFKAINICDDFEQCEYELREAKEHLDRAGYDTMELLAANIGITIVEKLKRYDTKTITEVFPYYFTTIKPHPSFSLQYGLASAFLFPQLGTLIPSGCPIPTLAASLWSSSRYFLLPNSGWPVNTRGRVCHSLACFCYPSLRVSGLSKPPHTLANVKGALT